MARGRLIRPLTVEIARVDPAAIEAAANYDRHFRTVKKVDSDNDGIGEKQREEQPTLTLKAQIEVSSKEQRQMSAAGDVPNQRFILVFHRREFEQKGLINSDGSPKLKVGDRLMRILDRHGRVMETFERVPIYAKEVRPGDGWLGWTSNLIVATFEDRPKGRVGA